MYWLYRYYNHYLVLVVSLPETDYFLLVLGFILMIHFMSYGSI